MKKLLALLVAVSIVATVCIIATATPGGIDGFTPASGHDTLFCITGLDELKCTSAGNPSITFDTDTGSEDFTLEVKVKSGETGAAVVGVSSTAEHWGTGLVFLLYSSDLVDLMDYSVPSATYYSFKSGITQSSLNIAADDYNTVKFVRTAGVYDVYVNDILAYEDITLAAAGGTRITLGGNNPGVEATSYYKEFKYTNSSGETVQYFPFVDSSSSSEDTSSETTSSEVTSSEDTSSETTSSEVTSSEDTSSETTSSEATSSETTSSEVPKRLLDDFTPYPGHEDLFSAPALNIISCKSAGNPAAYFNTDPGDEDYTVEVDIKLSANGECYSVLGFSSSETWVSGLFFKLSKSSAELYDFSTDSFTAFEMVSGVTVDSLNIKADDYNHIKLVKKDGRYKLYVNNVLAFSDVAAAGTINGGTKITIGANNTVETECFFKDFIYTAGGENAETSDYIFIYVILMSVMAALIVPVYKIRFATKK